MVLTNNQEEGYEPNEQAEPTDIAQAFRMVREMEQGNAPHAMADDGGSDGSDGSGEADGSDDYGNSAQEQEPAGSYDNDRGSSDSSEQFDYNASIDAWKKSVSNAAYKSVMEELKKNDVREFTMNDLYERNESTGQIRFKDPDNPGGYFRDRSEAQSWIDSFNGQLKNEINSMVQRKSVELGRERRPEMELLQFGSRYDSLDDEVKEVLEDLVSGYEITDANGEVIGYRCDLNRAASQAESIVGKTRTRYANASATKPTGPATKMKTSQSASSNTVQQEPTNLSEALKMYQESQRKGK